MEGDVNVRTSDQKVRRRLTIRAVVPKIGEILFGFVCGSEVDLPAFIQYRNFIEHLKEAY